MKVHHSSKRLHAKIHGCKTPTHQMFKDPMQQCFSKINNIYRLCEKQKNGNTNEMILHETCLPCDDCACYSWTLLK